MTLPIQMRLMQRLSLASQAHLTKNQSQLRLEMFTMKVL